MRKLILISILIILLITSPCLAGGIQDKHRAVIAAMSAGGVPPDCSETFTTGDTDDVDGNSSFDAESDSASLLQITSGKLRANVGTNGQNSYVSETSCLADSDTEYTIKGTIEFEDIVDIDDFNSTNIIVNIKPDSVIGDSAYVYLAASGGDIYSYYVVLITAGSETGNTVVMSGLAADTAYDFVLYYKKDASVGEAYFKIGAWDASTTGGNDDNSSIAGGGTFRIGAVVHYWGDGTTDTFIKYDDFEYYKSDQR